MNWDYERTYGVRWAPGIQLGPTDKCSYSQIIEYNHASLLWGEDIVIIYSEMMYRRVLLGNTLVKLPHLNLIKLILNIKEDKYKFYVNIYKSKPEFSEARMGPQHK